MSRKGIVVLSLALLALFACGDDTDVVIAEDPDVVVDEDGEVDEVPPQAPVPDDDCAEVSAAEGAPVGVTMSDNFFEPPCIAISSTQQIALTNAGNLLHNFSVADGDIDVDVESGDEATTDETGTDLTAGTYRFYCKYHEGDGMVGTLVVE